MFIILALLFKLIWTSCAFLFQPVKVLVVVLCQPFWAMAIQAILFCVPSARRQPVKLLIHDHTDGLLKEIQPGDADWVGPAVNLIERVRRHLVREGSETTCVMAEIAYDIFQNAKSATRIYREPPTEDEIRLHVLHKFPRLIMRGQYSSGLTGLNGEPVRQEHIAALCAALIIHELMRAIVHTFVTSATAPSCRPFPGQDAELGFILERRVFGGILEVYWQQPWNMGAIEAMAVRTEPSKRYLATGIESTWCSDLVASLDRRRLARFTPGDQKPFVADQRLVRSRCEPSGEPLTPFYHVPLPADSTDFIAIGERCGTRKKAQQ
ncbi:hypothetical protein Q8F55_008470 [Vanrija albida]|uniref:Uncharacterized protein n=1 Tax=Vanrija albida TaxID=181172 RepID=A0ABR3PQX1_9TREE